MVVEFLVGVAASEVRVAHRRVRTDVRRRALGDHAPEVDARRSGRRSFITRSTSCSTSSTRHAPFVGEAPDQRGELAALGLVEAGGGLVEHDHRRSRRDRARDADQAPASVRQLVRVLVEVRSELELLDRRDRGRGQIVTTGPEQIGEPRRRRGGVGAGADVLLDAHVVEQLERLERTTQPAAGSLGRPTIS